MDTTNSVSSLRPRTPSKRCKPDKINPIKVVYISNPMNFSVTAAEFRALVQELTGKDSDSVGGVGGGGAGDQTTDDCETKNGGDDENDRSTSDGTTMVKPQVEANNKDCKWEGQIGGTMEWFEAFDDVDVITTQISAFYESSQADLQVLHAL